MHRRGMILVEMIIGITLFSLVLLTIQVVIGQHISITQLNTSLLESAQTLITAIKTKSETGGDVSITTFFITPCLFESTFQSRYSALSLNKLYFDDSENNKRYSDCHRYTSPFNTQHVSITFLPTPVITPVWLDTVGNSIIVGGPQENNATSTVYLFSKKEDGTYLTTTLDVPGLINQFDATPNSISIAKDAPNQLYTLNLSPASSPISNSLPNVSGSYPAGRSIFVYDNHVYVGTHRTAGNEFHIFKNPQQPQWLSSLEINHNINQISIKDNTAYLATSGNTDDVILVDISNPSAPKKIGSIQFPGTADTLTEYILGKTLYAGRRSNKKSSEPELIACDISSTSPAIISSKYISSDILGILAEGNYIFFISNSITGPFFAVLYEDSEHMFSEIYRYILPDIPTAIDYQNTTVYIALKNHEIALFTF